MQHPVTQHYDYISGVCYSWQEQVPAQNIKIIFMNLLIINQKTLKYSGVHRDTPDGVKPCWG